MLLTTTLVGFGIIVLCAAILWTTYAIGHVATILFSDETKHGHGARWFLGLAVIFLTAASYYIGNLIT